MASIVRQPFAPLDGARLQSLTSLKNRQNAIPPNGAGAKRKAADLADVDDFENVDPVVFAKRSKGASSSSFPSKDILKQSFHLTKASVKESISTTAVAPTSRPIATPRRSVAQQHAKPASAPKINTTVAKSSPLSAPAGRSPTRGKKSGLLSSRRRTTTPFARDSLIGSAPFSLDAALKGTVPSYAPRAPKAASLDLAEPDISASWFFDIHEDTPEQEMTNLLQHGTCVLDISSDEESAQKATREKAEGRDKENIPPADDVSQTSSRRAAAAAARNADDMIVEKERVALGEMNAADYYAEGCDETSVFIVHDDDAEEEREEKPHRQHEQQPHKPIAEQFEFAPELKLEPEIEPEKMEALVEKCVGAEAAVLQPIEGTGESFELWESGSAKDEGEAQ